jgi:trk system potassium uptake protein
MHLRVVANIIFAILVLTGIAMVPPLLVAVIDGTPDLLPLLLSITITEAVGVSGFFWSRRNLEHRRLSHRDGYLVGALGWLAACIVGALPFFFFAHFLTVDQDWYPQAENSGMRVCELSAEIRHPGREFCSFTDSMFESVSGFTTTGASVIRVGLWDDMDSQLSEGKTGLPRGLLLWRSLIQWLGGMGILVLAITILSLVGIGGMQLMKAEVPGPTPGRLSPRIADTARLLWSLYCLISAAEIIMLMLGGMDWYNAIGHTCTTMATGGFSTLAGSIGGMNSAYFDWVFTLFMLIAGANFTLHYMALFERSFLYHRDFEFRVYGFITLFCVLAIVVGLYQSGMNEGVEATVRSAAFQTASILTTTGFATRDFGIWPTALQFLLLTLMFVGGCAGSTGGGMKVARIIVVAKVAYRELLRIAHPRAVSPVRLGKQVVKEPVVQAILGVVVFFISAFVLSTLALAALGLDLVTSISSVAACIGNVGPGLGGVGPVENYFFIPTAGKWLLLFNMLAGRLEIYTVLILFSPHFWKR